MHYFLILVFLLYSQTVVSALQCPPYRGANQQVSQCTIVKAAIQRQMPVDECNCTEPSNGPPPAKTDNFCECVKNTCTENCQSQINAMHSCANTKNNNPNFCGDQCEDNLLFTIENTNIKRACAEENKDAIQKTAKEHCRGTINELSNQNSGKRLVCPNNQNCESFCENAVSSEQINHLPHCGGDSVATQSGYQDCWEDVQTALRQQLPSNVSELASKDFRWEACDLDQDCDRSLEYAFNSVNRDCEHLKAQANVCCDNPLCCENPTECQQQQGASLIPSAGPDMFKGLSSTSVCKKGEQWMQDQTGAVQKMANLCENKAHRCISACGQKISEIQSQFYETCTFDLLADQHYDPARHTCSEGLITKYLSFFREGPASTLSHCKTTRNTKPHQMRQVMEVLIATASQLKDCVQAVSAGTGTDSPTADQAGHTTTSANEGIVIGEEHLYTGQIESDPYLNGNSAGREDTGTASPGGGMGPGGGGAPSPGSASARATASSVGLGDTTGFTTKKPNKIKQMPPPPSWSFSTFGS